MTGRSQIVAVLSGEFPSLAKNLAAMAWRKQGSMASDRIIQSMYQSMAI